MAELHPKVQRFGEMLDEASALLRLEARKQGQEDLARWAAWLEDGARRTRRRDLGGVLHVLRAYGGMGSFNDSLPSDSRLGRLRTEIWILAHELVREEYEAERGER